MWRLLKKLLNLFVPTHIHDPGLAIRMMRSGNPAAWFTLATTALGLLMTPLDMLLARREKTLYQRAKRPSQPIIFVCGAPRTGTTLMEQFLIKHLDVAYFNNLTSVFVRSPITANKLFGRLIGPKRIDYSSYYSKTLHFTGPNDAFYLWNRWMTEDETGMQCVLLDDKRDDIVQFFGAYEEAFGKPLVSKNNSLNTRAKTIADLFENAYFICMTRDDSYLAQALLQTRMEIQGDIRASYGVDNPHKAPGVTSDYVTDVCDQVLYHKRKIHEQRDLIGPDRFWIIQYEDFCQNPAALLQRVYEEILEQPAPESVLAGIEPFRVTNRVRLEPELFQKIEETLLSLEKPSVKPVNS